jgi:hypothetical protein
MWWRVGPAFLLCSFMAGAGSAKCPHVHYTVEGTLLLPSDVSADRVRVYLLVDGMSRTSDYPATRSEPDYEHPDNNGRFLVESWVSTASGDPDSDREQCKRVEGNGEIFVAGDGIYARRARVAFAPSPREIRKRLEATGRLAPILIEPLPLE